jgi:hypothetical protein
MGYDTRFEGQFNVTPKLTDKDKKWLLKFSNTRRMKRDPSKLKEDPKEFGFEDWGDEGEFYVHGKGFMGQSNDPSVTAHNDPPATQPGLWCHWIPNDDGTAIIFDDDTEKFTGYVEWLQYLLDKFLVPRGYDLDGMMDWQGDDMGDVGRIIVVHNDISTVEGLDAFAASKVLKKDREYDDAAAEDEESGEIKLAEDLCAGEMFMWHPDGDDVYEFLGVDGSGEGTCQNTETEEIHTIRAHLWRRKVEVVGQADYEAGRHLDDDEEEEEQENAKLDEEDFCHFCSALDSSSIYVPHDEHFWIEQHSTGVLSFRHVEFDDHESPIPDGDPIFVQDPEKLLALLHTIVSGVKFQAQRGIHLNDRARRKALGALSMKKFGSWNDERDRTLEVPDDETVNTWLREAGLEETEQNREHIQLIAKNRRDEAERAVQRAKEDEQEGEEE